MKLAKTWVEQLGRDPSDFDKNNGFDEKFVDASHRRSVYRSSIAMGIGRLMHELHSKVVEAYLNLVGETNVPLLKAVVPPLIQTAHSAREKMADNSDVREPTPDSFIRDIEYRVARLIDLGSLDEAAIADVTSQLEVALVHPETMWGVDTRNPHPVDSLSVFGAVVRTEMRNSSPTKDDSGDGSQACEALDFIATAAKTLRTWKDIAEREKENG